MKIYAKIVTKHALIVTDRNLINAQSVLESFFYKKMESVLNSVLQKHTKVTIIRAKNVNFRAKFVKNRMLV